MAAKHNKCEEAFTRDASRLIWAIWASLEAAEAVQKLGNQSASPVIHVQMKKGIQIIQIIIVIYCHILLIIIILHFDAAEK